MNYEDEKIAEARIAEVVEAETVVIESTLDEMIQRLRDVDLDGTEIGFEFSKRDAGGYYVGFAGLRLGWIVKNSDGTWTAYRPTDGPVGKRVSNGTARRYESAIDLGWNVGSLAFDRYEFVSLLAVRRHRDYDLAFLLRGDLPEVPVAAPEFDFPTVEKARRDLDADDQVVGVRFGGELVARFIRATPEGDVDFERGFFWDGSIDTEEDLSGERTFVVRVVETSDEPIAEGDVVRFVDDYSTGVLVDGGPTAPKGHEAVVEEVGDLDGDGYPKAILVQFPETDFGFSPRQYVPATVLEVVVRQADLDSASENDDDDPTSVFAEFGPDVEPCSHDVDRDLVRSKVHGWAVVCPSCGHEFFAVELCSLDSIQPGDVLVTNSLPDVNPPYWNVERVVPGSYDSEAKLVVFRDHPDGLVERNVWDVPSCFIAAVRSDLHATNVERTAVRNDRVLSNIAGTLFLGTHYFDDSGDWEVEALHRDFISGGGHGLDLDTVEVALEVRVERLRAEARTIASEKMAESVYEAVRSAAPRPFSAVWADALVVSVESCSLVPPTAKFLAEGRTQVAAKIGR